jgi:hypothetical protein
MRLSSCSSINRRVLLAALATLAILSSPLFPLPTVAEAPLVTDALPSWNNGAAKQAIVDFVKVHRAERLIYPMTSLQRSWQRPS